MVEDNLSQWMSNEKLIEGLCEPRGVSNVAQIILFYHIGQ